MYPDRFGPQGVKEAAEAELAGHYARIDGHLAGQEGPAASGSSARNARSPTSSSSW